jgi:hypothetical protein
MLSNFGVILFKLKWTFMSPEARYAYLWNQTRAGMQMVHADSLLVKGSKN